MKIIQIVKKLNNTELGKAGTNDTYVLIPNDMDVSDIFDRPNTEVEFTDRDTGEKVTVRHTVRREKRIVGLGQYYRNKDLYAGDEIIFERQMSAGKANYIIYTQKYSDILVIQKNRHGFEVLTPARLPRFLEAARLLKLDVKIELLKSEKKRSDSPEGTDFYNVMAAGKNLMNVYKGKELVEMRIRNSMLEVSGFYGWKKYSYEMGDEG